MKKKILLLVSIILLLCTNISAESLSVDAQYIKDECPDIYCVFYEEAKKTWPNNPTMQLYTINTQIDSAYNVTDWMDVNAGKDLTWEELFDIFSTWSDVDLMKYDDIWYAPINWVMVEYSINSSIESKKALE